MNTPKYKICDRLRQALDYADMKAVDLSKITQIPKASISQYLSGYTEPKSDRLYKMAKTLNVSPVWLMGYDVPINTDIEVKTTAPTTTGIKIPVLGRVAAGIPIDAIEDVLDWEEIPQSMAATGEYFGLKIKGDSMLPDIKNGDVVIVRRQEQVENGEIAIVLINGDEATAKKVKHTESGIMLIPNNPSFEPMFFSKEEIATKPVQIIGRVVELRRTI